MPSAGLVPTGRLSRVPLRVVHLDVTRLTQRPGLRRTLGGFSAIRKLGTENGVIGRVGDLLVAPVRFVPQRTLFGTGSSMTHIASSIRLAIVGCLAFACRYDQRASTVVNLALLALVRQIPNAGPDSLLSAGSEDIVRILHSLKGVHIDAERLFRPATSAKFLRDPSFSIALSQPHGSWSGSVGVTDSFTKFPPLSHKTPDPYVSTT
jgi:hypothetical protein